MDGFAMFARRAHKQGVGTMTLWHFPPRTVLTSPALARQRSTFPLKQRILPISLTSFSHRERYLSFFRNSEINSLSFFLSLLFGCSESLYRLA
jgi:hypothetical protein